MFAKVHYLSEEVEESLNKNRRQKFILKGGEFLVEISWHHGFKCWYGEFHHMELGTNATKNWDWVKSNNKRKIPGLLRRKIAERLNPKVAKVTEKIEGDSLAAEGKRIYKAIRMGQEYGMGPIKLNEFRMKK